VDPFASGSISWISKIHNIEQGSIRNKTADRRKKILKQLKIWQKDQEGDMLWSKRRMT
jgi:hypothetical protein